MKSVENRASREAVWSEEEDDATGAEGAPLLAMAYAAASSSAPDTCAVKLRADRTLTW